MTQEEKKLNEITLIAPLCEKLGIPIPKDPAQEHPDFIIEIDGELVGVEVTLCCPSKKYIQSKIKSFSVSAICRNRIQKAKQEFSHRMKERGDNRAIMLNLNHKAYWDIECKSEKEFIDKFCNEIDHLLLNHQQNSKSSTKEHANKPVSKTNHIEHKYIESIGLLFNSKEPFVGSLGRLYVQSVTQTDLDGEFEAKNKKLEQYKKNPSIKHFWLVIGILKDEPYSFYEDAIFYNKSKSHFERVFLVNHNKVMEII